MILYGPPGSGKSCAVYAVARDMDIDVLEMNASDFRNKNAMETIVGPASKQRSLFNRGKVIVIDEADGMSGTKDRGGISSLAGLIKETEFPIVVIVNDPFDKKFSSIRALSQMVEFKELSTNSISDILSGIAKRENIKYDDIALKSLSRRAGGDARAAINDLQNLTMADNSLKIDDVKGLSDREQTEDITNALMLIFKTTDPTISVSALDNVNADLNEAMLWIDENLPYEYTKAEDLARAYDFLSRADIMNSRIIRWQHWRFLVYVNSLMTGGVSVSKEEKYKQPVAYKRSMRPLKIWQAKMRHMKRNSIAEKIASHTHSSTQEVIKDTLPFMLSIMKKPGQMRDSLIEQLELDDDEIDWLKR